MSAWQRKCSLVVVQVLIGRNYGDLSERAAAIVEEAIRAKPQLTLCLPTGSTPKGMYRELIRRHREKRLDFSRVNFFHLDEYSGLRPDHPQSFRVYLWREFLNYVNVRRTNVYLPDENYEETIRRAGGIDLLISGIGVNGHIAFNEPGSPLDSRTRIVDLSESTIDAIRSSFSPADLPRQAITMGLGTILDAERIVLLASNSRKASIVARALIGDIGSEVPASIVPLHPHSTIIIDEEAAAEYSNLEPHRAH
jgi:glucosamine-6-phosphate deaminase